MTDPIFQFFFLVYESVISIGLIYLFVEAVLSKSNKATPRQLAVILCVSGFVQVCFNYIFPRQDEINAIFFQGFIVGVICRIAMVFIIAMICFRARPLTSLLVAFLEMLMGLIIILILLFILAHDFSNFAIEFVRDGMLRTSQYTRFSTVAAIATQILIIVLIKHLRGFRVEQRYFKLQFILVTFVVGYIFVLIRTMLILNAHPYDYMGMHEIMRTVPILALAALAAPTLAILSGIWNYNTQNQKIFLLQSQHMAQLKHVDQLISSYEKIRKASHDFKHRVDILQMLSFKNENEKLAKYIAGLSKQDVQMSIVETGNVMLDAVLSFKKEKAEAEKIAYNVKLDIQPELSYINDEICVLLSNALDNAIESCMRMDITDDSENRRFIDMDLTATDALFMCCIRNAVAAMPQIENGILKTSKKDKKHHGVGMRSMEQTCEDFGGDLAYEYDENEFILWINLPTSNLAGKHQK